MSERHVQLWAHERQALPLYALLSGSIRFACLLAGRRFGKTEADALWCTCETMLVERNGYSLREKEVWFVAPTEEQGMIACWDKMCRIAYDNQLLAERPYESRMMMKFINGRRFRIRGSANPETLRGPGLSAVAIDEYATMRPKVWPMVLRPMLTDVQGSALFTGSVAGRNHFWDLVQHGLSDDFPDWGSWIFTSLDNPFLDKEEIEQARRDLTPAEFAQEYLSDPGKEGDALLDVGLLQYELKPNRPGRVYIGLHCADHDQDVIDANMESENASGIVAVMVTGDRWHILDTFSGRANVGELLVRVVKMSRDYGADEIVLPDDTLDVLGAHLDEQMERSRFHIEPLPVEVPWPRLPARYITHALQPRLRRKRLSIAEGEAGEQLRHELRAYPHEEAQRSLLSALTSVHAAVEFGESVGSYTDRSDEGLIDAEIGY